MRRPKPTGVMLDNMSQPRSHSIRRMDFTTGGSRGRHNGGRALYVQNPAGKGACPLMCGMKLRRVRTENILVLLLHHNVVRRTPRSTWKPASGSLFLTCQTEMFWKFSGTQMDSLEQDGTSIAAKSGAAKTMCYILPEIQPSTR